jgi:hypothetical protein
MLLQSYPGAGVRLIGSYIRSWERPGDLPRVIEFFCLFTTISITRGRSPGLSQQRSYFMYGVSHEGKYCTFNTILVRKAQISVESFLVY